MTTVIVLPPCDVKGIALTLEACVACTGSIDLGVPLTWHYYVVFVYVGFALLGAFWAALACDDLFEARTWLNRFRLLGALYYYQQCLSLMIYWTSAFANGAATARQTESASADIITISGAPHNNCDAIAYDVIGKTYVFACVIICVIMYALFVPIGAAVRERTAANPLLRFAGNWSCDLYTLSFAPGLAAVDLIPWDSQGYTNPMWVYVPALAITQIVLLSLLLVSGFIDARSHRQVSRFVVVPFVYMLNVTFSIVYIIMRFAVAPSGGDVVRYLMLVGPPIAISGMMNLVMYIISGGRLTLWTKAWSMDDLETTTVDVVPFGLGDAHVNMLAVTAAPLFALVTHNDPPTPPIVNQLELRQLISKMETSSALLRFFSHEQIQKDDDFAQSHDLDPLLGHYDAVEWKGADDLNNYLDTNPRPSARAGLGAGAGANDLEFDVINAFFEDPAFGDVLNHTLCTARQRSVCDACWLPPRMAAVRSYVKALLIALADIPPFEDQPDDAFHANFDRVRALQSWAPLSLRRAAEIAVCAGNATAFHTLTSALPIRFVVTLYGDVRTHPALPLYAREESLFTWNCIVKVLPFGDGQLEDLAKCEEPGIVVVIPPWAVRRVESARSDNFVVLPEITFRVVHVERFEAPVSAAAVEAMPAAANAENGDGAVVEEAGAASAAAPVPAASTTVVSKLWVSFVEPLVDPWLAPVTTA